MFTGIVERTAVLIQSQSGEGGINISVEKPGDWIDLWVGESIAVNGVCLTLESWNEKAMRFFVGFETLKVTDFKKALSSPGKSLNLERSLRFGDRISGHMVSGHVDEITRVLDRNPEGECLFLKFELPLVRKSWILPKGSVALNGVSLTVNTVGKNDFSVLLIPETLRKTNLGALQPGDQVNIEFDQMAKAVAIHVENYLEARFQ